MEIDGVLTTRYVHWGGTNPASVAKHLKTWGKAGTVKVKITAVPRVADWGMQCMMVGYAIDHDRDCYRMWDPNKARVHEIRDIIWSKHMFYQKQNIQNVNIGMELFDLVTPASKSRKRIEEESESDDNERIDNDDGADRATLKDAVIQLG